MPLDQAEPALRRRLLHSKQERVLAEFQTSLRTGLQVEVYPDQLERVQAAVPEATPPSPSIP